jgi:hypothetical protein
MAHIRNKQRDQARAEPQNKSSAEPAKLQDLTPVFPAKTSLVQRVTFTMFYAVLPVAVVLTHVMAPLQSYVAGALAVTVIPVLLALDPRLSGWRARNSLVFNFALTIAATSVGVFLGLYMTTKEADRVEVERASRFLSVAAEDLNSIARQMGVFTMGMKDDSDSDFSGSDLAQRNPRPSPETFFALLSNDAVLRRVSPGTLAQLQNSRRNMNTAIRLINTERMPNKKLKPIVDVYGKELHHAEQILAAEIEFMNGRIDQKTLDGMSQMFMYQELGITPKDVDSLVKHPSSEPFDWNKLDEKKDSAKP